MIYLQAVEKIRTTFRNLDSLWAIMLKAKRAGKPISATEAAAQDNKVIELVDTSGS